ncbi:MAG: GNAT family N-acetyltransferase [Gammaproteobacteria bacterium]|nr:MAG: GNAT family N-acetyltransferase [Gammaproteobacteria bacterium]
MRLTVPRLRTATAEDAESIRILLERAGLPTSDLTSSKPEFIVAYEDAELIGTGALQRFETIALLRSVAVSSGRRGGGIGRLMVQELERRARAAHVTQLVLLTQTARRFFEHQGYRALERHSVPRAVQASEEFRSLCPTSATCMSKTLATPVAERPCNVLFLCTGNSARSILAESLISHWGRGRFRGLSAGSHPRGAVHPVALELLRQMRLPTAALRSKSWDEFAAPAAPPLDFVFTVCDQAAGEVCPYWPGQPMTAHWGVPDPAAVEGSETQQWLAFRTAFRALENRIRIFTSLPIASIDRLKLQQHLDAIGRMPAPDESG